MEPESKALMRSNAEREIYGISCINSIHANQRFEVFAKNNKLIQIVHSALWRVIMLRSFECYKLTSNDQMIQDACFCDACCMIDEDDELDSKMYKLMYLQIIPGYEWYPPQNGTHQSPDGAVMEQVVHRYMVRMGRLPAPLSSSKLKLQNDEIGASLKALGARIYLVPTDGFVGIEQTKIDITTCAKQTDMLFITICGHGRENDGAIWLSDGTTLSCKKIAEILQASKFTGTVILVINACHAEGNEETLAHGFDRDSPFKWVVIFSSGYESQKMAHAVHVAKLVNRLVETNSKIYDEGFNTLQSKVDRYWVETRNPKQSYELWRGPPLITTNRKNDEELFLPI